MRPRDHGPIPLITSKRRLTAQERKRREVCCCDSCVAQLPSRAAIRQWRADQVRRRLRREVMGVP